MTSLSDAYIIVVEDDPNARLVTIDLLRLGGSDQCFSRKSADAAIELAIKLPQIDLLLVDINMPGKSGFELLDEIRAKPQFSQTKVVAVTAGTFEEDVQKARDAGFDGFISKPLKTTVFPSQIQRILNGESIWDWR
ncbi:MAG: response regulator [Chloroflexi bacterium]|nr:MAG: response regulator [Chloroflexota bacterium]PIE80495.1 MAG: response regulator [Chloroflexota bacterium]